MMTEGQVGSPRTVVLDCPGPPEPAEFYAWLLGAELTDAPDDTRRTHPLSHLAVAAV